MLEEDELPVVIAQCGEVAVVGDVEEVLARALLGGSGDVVELVVTVEVHLVRRTGQVGATLEPVRDVGVSGSGQQGDEPVVVADDPVEHLTRRDAPRPAHHGRHPVGPLPVGVLLVPEGRHAGVRPAVHVRSVVGRVHDDRVVGELVLVEVVQHRPDQLVVVAHRVVVLRLPPAGLAPASVLDVGAEVHVRGVQPDEERGVAVLGLAHEAQGLGDHLVVDRLHPLLGERPGVLDALGAVVVGPGVDDPSRAEVLAEVRELLLGRVVLLLGLLLGVEVVQVAEELIEPVGRGEELVTVTEVVLAELAGGVPEGLEGSCDGRVLGPQPKVHAGHPHLGQAGAVGVLTGDERGSPCGAALLAVVVGEPDTLSCDAVDVRCPIAHQTLAVAAQVGDADVVAPDDEDVRLVGHVSLLIRRGCARNAACRQVDQPPATRTSPLTGERVRDALLHARLMQRNPRWDVEVSMGWAIRAAGRYRWQ